MSAHVNVDLASGAPTPDTSTTNAARTARVRPLYWSLRRELWENRSIYIAPLAVAAIILFSALVNVLRIPEGAVPFHRLLEVSPRDLRMAGISLYAVVAGILALTAGVVGWFYCLDALYGERRDRSVLFWKSLPVSDTTAVLSKVLIGMVGVPLIAIAVGIVLYVLLLLVASAILIANGVSATLLIGNASFFEAFAVHMYLTLAALLWSAPLYAWAIFVSSWARRAAFLWALIPPAAIGLAEALALRTTHFWDMLGERFSGGLHYAVNESAHGFDNTEMRLAPEHLPDSLLSWLDPVRFLSQSGLWIGLIVATVFIAASIWMRRYREPL